jgi:hypothetical protein
MEGRELIRYVYNSQKKPPAPFVLVTLANPLTGAEVRDVPAQLDTGADCTLVPQKIVEALGLNFGGSWTIGGVGGKVEDLAAVPGVHRHPPVSRSGG